MAKDNRNLIVISVILVIVASTVAVGFFLFNNPAYNPPPNFQVYFEGWLREDVGANPEWASKKVEVFTNGGEDYKEQITSGSDGKLRADLWESSPQNI